MDISFTHARILVRTVFMATLARPPGYRTASFPAFGLTAAPSRGGRAAAGPVLGLLAGRRSTANCRAGPVGARVGTPRRPRGWGKGSRGRRGGRGVSRRARAAWRGRREWKGARSPLGGSTSQPHQPRGNGAAAPNSKGTAQRRQCGTARGCCSHLFPFRAEIIDTLTPGPPDRPNTRALQAPTQDLPSGRAMPHFFPAFRRIVLRVACIHAPQGRGS